ncbi:MAG: YraN family protein [Campylobacter sp.]|nr:YraN family protein [Campylobacter sp.]
MSLKEYLFGFDAENKAVKFLEKDGFKILERNFSSKFGEIDIIAQKDEILHFIEVKATQGEYEAIYRITAKKLDKILKTVKFYMTQKQNELNFQIDAIVVNNTSLELIENITI